jgi:hypothetical protein
MDITAMLKDSLAYLFEGYCNSGGTGVFPLEGIAENYTVSANELGSMLKRQGWIKNPRFGATEFTCQISLTGIQQIQPNYFSDLISQALGVAGQINDWVGLIGSLPFQPRDYQRAHDLGRVFELYHLAEVQYQAQEVYIKPTLEGLERYRREYSGGFFG